MGRSPGRVLVLVVAALLLVAASPRREYLRVLDGWTEELKLYRSFDTALIMRGTYLDAPMRRALAAERRRLVNPTAENHEAFVARMSADQAEFHDIVFSASSALPASRTFGESDAGWVIWLEADGVREALVSVERIRRPSGLHTELYAHKTIWADLWIARFTRTVTSPDTVVLHVGSGYGNGDLVWNNLGARRTDPPDAR